MYWGYFIIERKLTKQFLYIELSTIPLSLMETSFITLISTLFLLFVSICNVGRFTRLPITNVDGNILVHVFQNLKRVNLLTVYCCKSITRQFKNEGCSWQQESFDVFLWRYTIYMSLGFGVYTETKTVLFVVRPLSAPLLVFDVV